MSTTRAPCACVSEISLRVHGGVGGMGQTNPAEVFKKKESLRYYAFISVLMQGRCQLQQTFSISNILSSGGGGPEGQQLREGTRCPPQGDNKTLHHGNLMPE